MNRKSRRRDAKLSEKTMFNIAVGYLLPGDRNFGSIVDCYLCDTTHKALGVAIIEKLPSTRLDVPLCEGCRAKGDDEVNNLVFREYLKGLKIDLSKFQIVDGGEVSDEQVLALRDKLGETEQ